MVMWSRRLSAVVAAAVWMLMWRRSLSPGPPAGFGSDPSRRSSLSLNPISVYRVLVLPDPLPLQPPPSELCL